MLNQKRLTLGEQAGYHKCGEDWFSNDKKNGELIGIDGNSYEISRGTLAKKRLFMDGLNNTEEFEEVVSELNIDKNTLI